MAKSNKNVNINQMIVAACKRGVKTAIDVSARSNTFLVVYQDGKVVKVAPPYKYVRVLSKRKSARTLVSKKQKKPN